MITLSNNSLHYFTCCTRQRYRMIICSIACNFFFERWDNDGLNSAYTPFTRHNRFDNRLHCVNGVLQSITEWIGGQLVYQYLTVNVCIKTDYEGGSSGPVENFAFNFRIAGFQKFPGRRMIADPNKFYVCCRKTACMWLSYFSIN